MEDIAHAIEELLKTLSSETLKEIDEHRIEWDRREQILMEKQIENYDNGENVDVEVKRFDPDSGDLITVIENVPKRSMWRDWEDPVMVIEWEARKQSIEDALKSIGDKYPECRDNLMSYWIVSSLFRRPQIVNEDLVELIQLQIKAMETLFGGRPLLFTSVSEFQLLAREVAYNDFCDEISDVKKTLPIGILVEINNHRIRWDRRERIMMKKKQIEYESEEYWNDPVVKDRKKSIEDAMRYIGDTYPKCREKPLFIPVIKSLFVVPHDVNGDLVDQVQCEMMQEESQ